MIIPSIDIMDGKAVQLRQGKERVLEREDVFALAEEFSRVGEIAVIDLDAALGQGDNRDLVRALCKRFPCRVGGGIRSAKQARELLKAGARRVIMGTAAKPEILKELKPEQVIVAVDEKDGEVVDQGWTHQTGESVLDRVKALEPYCSGFLYTLVDKEGMMGGTSIERIRAVVEATKNPITAAGGITTKEEVKTLVSMGCSVQLGMAVYTGKLDLNELFVHLVNFEKGGGLCATIVEDTVGRNLMLAYSNQESLLQALQEGKGVYWSRSRQALWEKGATSGHTQKLLSARLDCDRDAICFRVEQAGPACHLETPSCWGDLEMRPEDLERTLRDRLENPTDSFGSKLMADQTLIRRKLHEETWEFSNAETLDETIHEAADLFFFASALLVKRGLSWSDVWRELKGRQR